MKRLLPFAFAALAGAPFVRADVALASLFQDHAVLQRGAVVPVWGRADPGERVTVTFRDQTAGTTTASDGRWIALLPALEGSSESAPLTVTGKNVVTLRDVVVGEVWLCSGQSNMELPVARVVNAAAEIAAANFPLIRQVRINHAVASAPAESAANSGWLAATPENVSEFTAAGYFFARDVQRKIGVPIGLIHSSWGGTPIESWMSAFALNDPAFAAVHARWAEDLAAFPARQAAYPAARAAWDAAEARAKATRTKNPLPWPRAPAGPGTPFEVGGLFNGMIAPLMPYAIRGALWYQGESNAPRPAEYRALFPALIRSWRAHWGGGDFPFYFVQLASFQSTDFWPPLREAQAAALALPNTGMAVAIDIGEPNDIHPRNKQEVGRRLASIAETELYDIPGDCSGPVFASATPEGAALRVRFTHVASGLVAYDKPVQALEVAGADRVFHPAGARIDRGTLVVAAPNVKRPVAVRYAWANAPEANLFNGAGLPAAPFRSDDW